jgi:hypothetical protein
MLKKVIIMENMNVTASDEYKDRYAKLILKHHDVISQNKHDPSRCKAILNDIYLKLCSMKPPWGRILSTFSQVGMAGCRKLTYGWDPVGFSVFYVLLAWAWYLVASSGWYDLKFLCWLSWRDCLNRLVASGAVLLAALGGLDCAIVLCSSVCHFWCNLCHFGWSF